MSPLRYELGFYIPEDDILHSHCRENVKSYIGLVDLNDISYFKYEDLTICSTEFRIW
jgi:hypothetical protein